MATPITLPLVAVSPNPGAKTVQLPLANSVKGRFYIVYDSDGFANTGLGRTITISRNGTDVIENGLTSITMGTAYSSICLISNGISTWYVLSRGNRT